jgi:hypothetical protein
VAVEVADVAADAATTDEVVAGLVAAFTLAAQVTLVTVGTLARVAGLAEVVVVTGGERERRERRNERKLEEKAREAQSEGSLTRADALGSHDVAADRASGSIRPVL